MREEFWTGETWLQFNYRDSKGQLTTREVLARSIYEKNGHLYLSGISSLRKAYREFRVERIASEIIDAESGAVGTLQDVLGVTLPDPGRDETWTYEPLSFDDLDELRVYGRHAHREIILWVARRKAREIAATSLRTVLKPTHIEMYKAFKNGKLHKRPQLWLRYSEEARFQWVSSSTSQSGYKDHLRTIATFVGSLIDYVAPSKPVK
ncbi:hypothetical protein J2T57_002629 [Natronocella acetinitrilica]|uniref:WYL domain-containing protein n=1 Tax=Natronocella acetinitrilica TaxID=414046 RepID=A0AAE3G5M6_9GAMM|nr:WYL domain-containing protein [Natronocella acetinitrilica]MCP1675479.1 hypothetical protein [Natronocella acetinitrilica]